MVYMMKSIISLEPKSIDSMTEEKYFAHKKAETYIFKTTMDDIEYY